MCEQCVKDGIMTQDEADRLGPVLDRLLSGMATRNDGDEAAKFEAGQTDTINLLVRTSAELVASNPGAAPHELAAQYAGMAMYRIDHKDMATLLAELAFYFLRASGAANKVSADTDDDLDDLDPITAYAIRLADAADEVRTDGPDILQGMGIVRSGNGDDRPGMYL